MAYPQSAGAAAPQKPSKTGIIWAIVIFVVTAIIGIVMIVVGTTTLIGAINDFKEVDVPGTSTVQLSAGEQWIFVGRPSRSTVDISDVSVSVTDPDGRDVDIDYDYGQSASNNDSDFESLGKFDAETSGAYTIVTTGPSQADVRIGKIPFLKIGVLIGGGFAVGGLGFLIAAIVLIVALVRRSRVKKANRVAAYGGPPQGAPYGAPAYGQPQGYGQPAPPAPPAPPAYGTPMPPPAPAAPPAPAPPAAPTTPPPPPAAPTTPPPPPAAPTTPPPTPGPTPPPPGPTPPPPGPTPPPPAPPA